MLKRQDLAKQFELVVQQEIINHNDQMLATNLSINSLKNDIDDLGKTFDKAFACLHSQDLKADTEFSRLNGRIHDVSTLLNKTIADQGLYNKNNIEVRQYIFDSIAERVADFKSLYDHVQEVASILKEVNKNFDKKSDGMEMSFKGHYNRFIEALAMVKQELFDAPSEAQAMKSEIDKRLDIDRVDFEGVMQELRSIKKEAFVQSKYIEFLCDKIKKLEAKE